MQDHNKTKEVLIAELNNLRAELAAEKKKNQVAPLLSARMGVNQGDLALSFDQSPLPVLAHQAGRMVYANQAAADVSGCKDPAELLKKPDNAFVSGGQEKVIESNNITDLRNLSSEIQIEQEGGADKWLSVYSFPILLEGKPSVLTIGSDITEQWVQEQTFRESKARYASLFEHGLDGIFMADDSGRYIDVNPAACELLGYTKEELLQKSVADVTAPEYLEDYENIWREYLEVGRQSGEYQVIRKDGSKLDVSYRAVADIAPGVHMSVMQDISERKRAEEYVRYQAQILNNVSEAVIATDNEFRIQSWNPAAERLYGWKQEEVIGRPFGDVIVTKYSKPTREEVLAEFHEKMAWEGVVIQKNRQGDEFFIHSSVTAMMDGEGNQIGAIASNRDISDRIRAEEKLKHNEELLNETGEMARVGGWEINLPTGEVYWTKVTGLIHETPPDYYPSLDEAVEFYAPDYRPIVAEAVRKAREEGQSYDLELEFITAKGKQRWVRAIGKPEFVDGKCVRLSGTFQDITERKLAELALKESEYKYRTLFENMQQGVLYKTADGVLVDINSAGLEILNVSREEFVGKTSYTVEWYLEDAQGNLISPEDRPSNIALRTGQPVKDFLALVIHPTRNSSRWVLIDAIPYFKSGSDQVDHVFVTFHDITNIVEAEERIQRSEARYRLIADNIFDVIWLMDENLQYTYVSPSIEKLLGYTPEEFLQQPMENILEPNNYGEVIQLIQEHEERQTWGALDNRKKVWENQYIHKNGKIIWVEVTTQPVLNEEGEFIGVVGITRNIEARKQAEETIRYNQERLKILTQRLFTLQEDERHRISRDLHDEAGQALSVVKIYLNLLEDKVEENYPALTADFLKVKDALGTAHEQLRSLALSLRPTSLDALGLAKAVEQLCSKVTEDAPIDIKVEADDLPPIPGRAAIALYRIVQESLNNILAHAQASQVEVSLKLENGHILIDIRDDGIGFDPNRNNGGTVGLGILGMNERINALQGELEIKSVEGEGTTLCVRYPLPK